MTAAGSPPPRRGFTRSMKMAALPAGFAGRAAVGIGKRAVGQSAEVISQEIKERTAQRTFKVLGELKGGAMKIGQAMSMYEAMLPPELAEPFRDALTRLQDSAPPVATSHMHGVLADSLGTQWRELFLDFDDEPAAAASIGQVYRADWHDGRRVAVKVQYPGIADAIRADLRQLRRIARVAGRLVPGADVRPLVAEVTARVEDELDYALEASYQRTFAEVFDGDPEFVVPPVVHQAGAVLVTEWVEGTPLSELIANGGQADRDRAGLLFFRFGLSSLHRCRLVHGDPHPGNARLLPDGRLAVLDFGSCGPATEEFVHTVSHWGRRLLFGSPDEVEAAIREQGFVRGDRDVDVTLLRELIEPVAETLAQERFRFTRTYVQRLRERYADYVGDPRARRLSRQMNLPPEYFLIARMMSGLSVICQLEAEGPFRSETARWLPGLATDEELGSLAG